MMSTQSDITIYNKNQESDTFNTCNHGFFSADRMNNLIHIHCIILNRIVNDKKILMTYLRVSTPVI